MVVKRVLIACLLLGSVATGFLISNTPRSGRFVFEAIPDNRLPANILVDTESIPNVSDPIVITQDLMNQWNLVPSAEDVFGTATPGGPYNGTNVGDSFGRFTNRQFEVAFDDTGQILTHFGISLGVLGITLKSVTTDNGNLLDFLVVINTSPGALIGNGTPEQLFRATLLHELGHAVGLGHTPTGFVNSTTFGLAPANISSMPTMHAFRLPQAPALGGTLEGDDGVGLTEIYPGDTSGLGSISGTVRGVSGAGVNEIAVRAVGPQFGAEIMHIGVLSNADGSDEGTFRIPHLPPGQYQVVIETVNGRGSVAATALAGGTDSLGGNPFQFAPDEFWQPGDTYDPVLDPTTTFALVQVRPDRETGSIDFVLNGETLQSGTPVAGQLRSGDSRIGDAGGGFHFVDYYVFQGTSGDVVTLNVQASGFTPQLQLLRPGDLALEAESLPLTGRITSINTELDQTGAWRLAVWVRATTGNPGGTGNYSLTLNGATGVLPTPPPVTAATVTRGPLDPGAQQFASPVCSLPLLQLRFDAPSHEDFWLDSVTVRGSGSGDDRLDVTQVRLVHDEDGDGSASGDPTLATGAYAIDNGSIVFDDLDVTFPAGSTNDLLVVYEITVQSVASPTAGFSNWWLLVAVLPLVWLRRRARLLACLLALALVPLACGGGGGGGGCNGAFDPLGVAVDFQVTVGAGDIVTTTPTRDPADPLTFPAAPLASGTLRVSN